MPNKAIKVSRSRATTKRKQLLKRRRPIIKTWQRHFSTNTTAREDWHPAFSNRRSLTSLKEPEEGTTSLATVNRTAVVRTLRRQSYKKAIKRKQ
jgi:hypothetical protein